MNKLDCFYSTDSDHDIDLTINSIINWAGH